MKKSILNLFLLIFIISLSHSSQAMDCNPEKRTLFEGPNLSDLPNDCLAEIFFFAFIPSDGEKFNPNGIRLDRIERQGNYGEDNQAGDGEAYMVKMMDEPSVNVPDIRLSLILVNRQFYYVMFTNPLLKLTKFMGPNIPKKVLSGVFNLHEQKLPEDLKPHHLLYMFGIIQNAFIEGTLNEQSATSYKQKINPGIEDGLSNLPNKIKSIYFLPLAVMAKHHNVAKKIYDIPAEGRTLGINIPEPVKMYLFTLSVSNFNNDFFNHLMEQSDSKVDICASSPLALVEMKKNNPDAFNTIMAAMKSELSQRDFCVDVRNNEPFSKGKVARFIVVCIFSREANEITEILKETELKNKFDEGDTRAIFHAALQTKDSFIINRTLEHLTRKCSKEAAKFIMLAAGQGNIKAIEHFKGAKVFDKNMSGKLGVRMLEKAVANGRLNVTILCVETLGINRKKVIQNTLFLALEKKQDDVVKYILNLFPTLRRELQQLGTHVYNIDQQRHAQREARQQRMCPQPGFAPQNPYMVHPNVPHTQFQQFGQQPQAGYYPQVVYPQQQAAPPNPAYNQYQQPYYHNNEQSY